MRGALASVLAGGSLLYMASRHAVPAATECHVNTDVEVPLFSFGIIADVQWADVPDGSNFDGSVKRCFRGSLGVLSDAVDWWRAQPLSLTFVAQLGDLIDGRNAKLGTSQNAIEGALKHLRRAPCRVVSLIGNHELYNFDRPTLATLLGTAPESGGGREFYSFVPAQGWRIIVLDPYQESTLGWPAGDPRRARAEQTLAANNPNDLSTGQWFTGLVGVAKRFVPYNGGLGREQLRWLHRELRLAAAEGELVIILSHAVLHPQACDGTTMAWDYELALESIQRSGVVALVLCGHDHRGQYHWDSEHGTCHQGPTQGPICPGLPLANLNCSPGAHTGPRSPLQ